MSPLVSLSKRTKVGLAASLAIAVVTALNGAAAKAATIFSDNFTGGSTLDATSSLATVGTNATNYQLVSSKSRVSPSIAANHLKFGIAATTSGVIEAQAQFPAITLATAGDYLEYTVVFNNANGLLTQASVLGFGLYNSNGSPAVLGGLNGNATANTTTGQFQNHTTDGTVGWQGYAIQLASTGQNSRVMDRQIQNVGTVYDNAQDLVTSGSPSSSYSYPSATTIGSNSASTLTLVVGSTYTEDMLVTLDPAGSGSLIITGNLYSGNAATGTPLSTFSGTTGTTPLSLTYDAFALGWRATANTSATAIDVGSITINSNVSPGTAVPEPATVGVAAVGALALLARRRKA